MQKVKMFKFFTQKTGPINAVDMLIRDTDTFIVSFPRSGNTWVRFLLAHLLNEGRDLDRHTIEKIVPDLYKSKEWIEKHQKDPRIIKTHEPAFHIFPKVVYICRDGRDALVSNYFYRYPIADERPNFSAFLKDNEFNLKFGWREHVDAFLHFQDKRPNCSLLVHYESLLYNTEDSLGKIASFCSVPFSVDSLKKAVSFCQIENLQRISMEKGTPYPTRRGVQMFREGKGGSWKMYFSEKENELFIRKIK